MTIPVYVISLQCSPERCEQIARQLNSFNIPFEIINAVDGKELDL